MKDKDVLWVMPLTKEEIEALPFPHIARALGGLLVMAPDLTYQEQLNQNLKVEALRSQFQKCLASAKPIPMKKPTLGGKK